MIFQAIQRLTVVLKQHTFCNFLLFSGNDNIHNLAKTNQKLRVDMVDEDGNKLIADFRGFCINNETDNYRLNVSY